MLIGRRLHEITLDRYPAKMIKMYKTKDILKAAEHIKLL